MKNKSFILRLKPIFLVLFALAIGQTAWADNVVGYDLTTDNTATVGLPANLTGTFSVSSSLTAPAYDGDGAHSGGWDAASQYWTISPFSTEGLNTITVEAFMNSEADGPKNFKLQYKIAAGAWVDASSITVSEVSASKFISLPIACANVPVLYVRWLNTDNVSVGGGTVTNSALSYIKAISVVGTLPIRPVTNASNITFTSITPTTITIDATAGQGDNRIIYISTTNSFPEPADNDVFTANSDYSTGNPTGPQVIYNGPGTNVIVTVPSSTNEYYVRIFNYFQNVNMPRYVTTTTTRNPTLCALATITTDPATLIRLTSATIGATITAAKSAISARGTLYKYDSSLGLATTGNKLAEGGTTDGSFTRALTGLTRAKRIYYKAYVTNVSGTIYSSELFFENYPIFTGSGNWETGSNWNVNEVPGTNGSVNGSVNDSPIINGTGACIMTASHNITNLTVNAGKSIQINTGATLNAAGSITNNAGTSGILIKSGNGVANGSLIWATGSPSGSVEMYSKAYTDGSAYPAKNRWQYFGIPVTSTTVGSTFGGVNERVRKYDESNTDVDGIGLWVPADPSHLNTSTLSGATTMVPVDGYEVVQPAAKTYTFTGELNHSNVSRTLTYSGGPWIGNHILANPFTAAINVSGITYSGGLENAVYIYNTGSRAEWISNSGESTPGSNPGTYSVSTGGFAGIFGVPAQIPSMQGFLVKATSGSNTFGIPLSALTTNNNPQRAPSTSEKVATMIDVIGAHSSDRMWIFSDANCTSKFDNGFDGPKILGSALNTQLFSMGEDGDYQINGVNDINNSYLGFQAGQDTEFKMVFRHQNLASMYTGLYLVDLVVNKTIDISVDGTEYSFTSEASGTASKRFKIITSTTKVFTADMDSEVKIFGSQNEVFVQNNNANAGNVVLYNMAGVAVRKSILKANGLTTLSNLNAGVYIAKVKTDKEDISKQIIIR